MKREALIHNILKSIQEKCKVTDPPKAKYAQAAISMLDEFDMLCSQGLLGMDLEPLLLLITEAPTSLGNRSQLPYAFFLHRLFLYGECYGMVHEDPIGTLALLNGALYIIQLYSKDDDDQLVTISLDLLLYQAIAYRTAGEDLLAKKALRSILELASEVESSRNEVTKEALPIANSVTLDIQIRAAPSAWLLARILKAEDEEVQATKSLALAHTLYKEILQSKMFPTSGIDRVLTMLGFAETLIVQESIDKSMQILKQATIIAEKDLGEKYNATYAFVASTVYHKRAEVYAVSTNWKRANKCFARALYWGAQAIAGSDGNTHYEDRYTEYMNEMGILYGVAGNLPKAQELFITTIIRRRKLATQSEQYQTGLASTLNNMSILMRNFGNDVVAKEYIQESIAILDKLDASCRLEGQDELRGALDDGLRSIDQSIKAREFSLWKPIWNTHPTNSSPN